MGKWEVEEIPDEDLIEQTLPSPTESIAACGDFFYIID